MQVVLPPELEALVQRQIASGKYQTVLDVLTAGVQLLDHQEPESEVENAPYGELDENLQFSPLSEEEMAQQSVAVLANYPHDAVPHDQVEIWANSLATSSTTPCWKKRC
jgi:Arc/MetJ-type ribon-helix-helix transcriptional regulator